ncbi:hypothetical protein [Rhizobium leguminosarum]|uniref:hypothetical protein n=1 Tax=Rhizobium leguminosarum TaxID=384 RepID=UPI003F96C2FC
MELQLEELEAYAGEDELAAEIAAKASFVRMCDSKYAASFAASSSSACRRIIGRDHLRNFSDVTADKHAATNSDEEHYFVGDARLPIRGVTLFKCPIHHGRQPSASRTGAAIVIFGRRSW